jgi:fumarate hydratase subunit beta
MKLRAPVGEEILKLNAGDIVYVEGEVLTARDKAHARIVEMLEKNMKLPL